jgi:hypothetical protein
VLGQEALDCPVHVDHVVRVHEPVSLVVLDHVFDFHATCAERYDEIIGFGLYHAWVVGSLNHQQGCPDLIHPGDR